MDNPCAVILEEIVNCDARSRPDIASSSAFKQIVKRTRKTNKNTEEIDIPEDLKFINEEKFVQYCKSGEFWIMVRSTLHQTFFPTVFHSWESRVWCKLQNYATGLCAYDF